MGPRKGIGHFRLERELGRGGQGVVYLATDTNLRRKVALKVMPGFAADAYRLRFEREIAAAARLHHPAICQILEAGDKAGARYIAMPYIEGQPLNTPIADSNKDGEFRVPARPRTREQLERTLSVLRAGRARVARCAPSRPHPPRHQTRQHHGDTRRRTGDPRLRPGSRRLGRVRVDHPHR